MADLLVKLYDFAPKLNTEEILEKHKVRFVRAMTPNKHQVLDFVEKTFDKGWASECEATFSRQPVSCIAALNEKNEVVGFGCYEATCKNYFGPTGVRPDYRKKGIGAEILKLCLLGLKELGYAYCIIGGVTENIWPFYVDSVGAIVIPDSDPGIYKDLFR